MEKKLIKFSNKICIKTLKKILKKKDSHTFTVDIPEDLIHLEAKLINYKLIDGKKNKVYKVLNEIKQNGFNVFIKENKIVIEFFGGN